MRRGIHTSEFWLTVATAAGSVAASLQGVLPPRYAAIAGATATGLYAVSRGLAKRGTP